MRWMDTASIDDFRRAAVTWLEKQISDAIAQRGRCVLGLSGGSTPKPIYAALGKNTEIDWSRVQIFLVDDRHITANHPDSNQHLAHTTLNAAGAIPVENFVFPDTTLPHDECAQEYARRLAPLLAEGPADLVTLGMGDDGHIASLFPPLSDLAFGPATVIATTTERFAVRDRISVTLPVLTDARARLFLLTGHKKSTWNDMMQSGDDPRRWPAKCLLDEKTAVLYAP